MTKAVDWVEVARLLDELYSASEGLEALFPARKFTLDGHLVGSIGEVVAAYMFDLELNPASTQGHDAKALDGRDVEIKLTQGKSIAVRHEPEHLIALHRPKGGPLQIVFNGPGNIVWAAAGKMQKNGQRPIGISKLKMLNNEIDNNLQLPAIRRPPI